MSSRTDRRRQIESFVRPLYVELDGIDTYEVVDRRTEMVGVLLGDRADNLSIDREYLDLLLLFHGTVRGLGPTDRGSRWWLFLRDLGFSDELIRRLAIGLDRWRDAPEGPEEEALHDAELLEEVGIGACARRIWRAGRKRIALARAIATLDAGPPRERFRTPVGRRLAAERGAAAEAWIEALRRSTRDG